MKTFQTLIATILGFMTGVVVHVAYVTPKADSWAAFGAVLGMIALTMALTVDID